MVCARTSKLGHKDLKSLLKWWRSLQDYHLDAPAVLRTSPPLSLLILKWSCEGATVIIEELLSVSFFWEFGNQETESLRGLPRVSNLVRDSTDSDHVAHTPSPHNGTGRSASFSEPQQGLWDNPWGLLQSPWVDSHSDLASHRSLGMGLRSGVEPEQSGSQEVSRRTSPATYTEFIMMQIRLFLFYFAQ